MKDANTREEEMLGNDLRNCRSTIKNFTLRCGLFAVATLVLLPRAANAQELIEVEAFALTASFCWALMWLTRERAPG